MKEDDGEVSLWWERREEEEAGREGGRGGQPNDETNKDGQEIKR